MKDNNCITFHVVYGEQTVVSYVLQRMLLEMPRFLSDTEKVTSTQPKYLRYETI